MVSNNRTIAQFLKMKCVDKIWRLEWPCKRILKMQFFSCVLVEPVQGIWISISFLNFTLVYIFFSILITSRRLWIINNVFYQSKSMNLIERKNAIKSFKAIALVSSGQVSAFSFGIPLSHNSFFLIFNFLPFLIWIHLFSFNNLK